MIFLDSNIVIDLIEGRSRFSEASRRAVARVPAATRLVANVIVLAECAGHFTDADEELRFLADLSISLLPISVPAAWRAGTAHRAYRRAGGERVGVLADFLIGGHAVDLGAPLMTRDRQRFASYFPELTLITPETDHG